MTGATPPVQTTKRKTKAGRVVSDKMDKTIVVSVERLARHPLYKRVIRLSTKFKAHDEANEAHISDPVLIQESRPLSPTKPAPSTASGMKHRGGCRPPSAGAWYRSSSAVAIMPCPARSLPTRPPR